MYSWNENTSEIEYILEIQGNIIPVEVKAGINTKAKSLQVFCQRYNPAKTILLCGEQPRISKTKHYRLPLYMARSFPL